MAIREFRLPDLGEGLTESEIVAWRVSVGDEVALNQVIAEVETAKAVVDLPSPYQGVVHDLHAPAGTTVAVGAPLISFEVIADAATDAPPPNLVGYGAAAEATDVSARRPRTLDVPATVSTAVPDAERSLAAPPVRKLAENLGVQLADLAGSGPRGRVTRADVEDAAASGSAAAPGATAPAGSTPGPADGIERIAVTGVRKLTAEAVTQSAFTAPHVTMFVQTDVTPTLELLDRLRATPRLRDERLTFLTAVARAVCLALRANPLLNARWDAESGSILRYREIGLGVAAATPRGLLVPVIADAGSLDFGALAGALTALVRTAREGTTTPAQLRGGTFTITNIGVFGVEGGTPILNAGEAGILAVGAVARRPWEFEGRVELRDVVTLSLSIDHRVIDGAEGARFLAEIAGLLADPASAFAL